MAPRRINGDLRAALKKGAVTLLVLTVVGLTQWGVSLNSKVAKLEATVQACQGLH